MPFYFTKLRMKRENPLLLDGVDCFPELWINVPLDGREAMPSNGAHVALFAADKAAVDLFHSVALSLEAVTMAPRDIVENINPATMRRSFAIRTGTN